MRSLTQARSFDALAESTGSARVKTVRLSCRSLDHINPRTLSFIWRWLPTVRVSRSMKLLREPLLHFTLAAVVLFSAYAWLNQSRPVPEGVEPVRIGEGEIEWLRETYTSQWRRPPDARELQGLIADLVTEELLSREARAMGLGENDTIIRRRLAQKLKFLVEDTSRLAEPSDSKLRQYFNKHIDRFESGATISFTHIFFNPQNHPDATVDATAALNELQKAGANTRVEIGDRFLLDTNLRDADEQAVSNMFGADFARAAFALAPGAWRGPLKSGYGQHLVFVSAKTAASQPAFETVRDQVAKEWRREKEADVSREYLARLREKYGVVLDDGVKAVLETQSATDAAVR